jgi:hypothetical protein
MPGLSSLLSAFLSTVVSTFPSGLQPSTKKPLATPSESLATLPSKAPSERDVPGLSSLPSEFPSAVVSTIPSGLTTKDPDFRTSTEKPLATPSDNLSTLPSGAPSEGDVPFLSSLPSEFSSTVVSTFPSGHQISTEKPLATPSEILSTHPSGSPSDRDVVPRLSSLPSEFPSTVVSTFPSGLQTSTEKPLATPSAIISTLPSESPSGATYLVCRHCHLNSCPLLYLLFPVDS